MNIKYSIINAFDRSVLAPSPFGEGWGGASAFDRSVLTPFPVKPGEGWGGALGLGRGFILLLLLLALAPAMAQNVAFTGDTTAFSVVEIPNDIYKWELYPDTPVDFAVTPGEILPVYAEFVGGPIGSKVNVFWKLPGMYFFKVTATDVAGCSTNFKIGIIEVKPGVTAVILPPDSVCIGEPVKLVVKLTGTAPWSFTYSGTNIDGVTTTKPITNITEPTYELLIDPSPTKTTDYKIISVSDIYGTNTASSNTVTQIIYPLPDPSNIIHR